MKTIKIDLVETETARTFGFGITAVKHGDFLYTDKDSHIEFEVSLDEAKYGNYLRVAPGAIVTDKGVLDITPTEKHLMDYDSDRPSILARWISNEGERKRRSLPVKLVADHTIW